MPKFVDLELARTWQEATNVSVQKDTQAPMINRAKVVCFF